MAGRIWGRVSPSSPMLLVDSSSCWFQTTVRPLREHGGCLGVGPARSRPFIWALSGSGPDGAEEIKRHVFYSTIDWNVSVSIHPFQGFNCGGRELLPTRASNIGLRVEGDSMALNAKAGSQGQTIMPSV